MSLTERQAQRMTIAELLAHRAQYSYHKPTVDIIDRELARRANLNSLNQNRQLQRNITRLEQRISTLTSSNTQLQQAVRTSNQQIQQMQTTHQQQVSNLQRSFARQLRDVDRQNLQRLQQLEAQNNATHAQMQEDYTQRIRNSEQNMQNMINSVANQLQNNITQVRNEANQRINTLQAQVNTVRDYLELMAHGDDGCHHQALEIYNAAIAVREETDAFNAENGHCWEELRRQELTNSESLTDTNLNDKTPGAGLHARNLALQQFHAALIFREQVFAREREWQAAHELTEAAVVEAEALLANTATITFGDERVDVDYWTCGELSRIGQRISALEDRLKDPSQNREQMDNDCRLALQYREEVEAAGIFALQARQLSYDRKELLENAVDRLVAAQNMVFQWAEYYGGDERLGRRVYLKRPADGLEIVITAEPVPQSDGTLINEMRSDIVRYPNRLMNMETIQRLQEDIMRWIKEGNELPFGTPQCAQQQDPSYQIDTGVVNGNRDSYLHVSEEEHRQHLEQQATPQHAAAK